MVAHNRDKVWRLSRTWLSIVTDTRCNLLAAKHLCVSVCDVMNVMLLWPLVVTATFHFLAHHIFHWNWQQMFGWPGSSWNLMHFSLNISTSNELQHWQIEIGSIDRHSRYKYSIWTLILSFALSLSFSFSLFFFLPLLHSTSFVRIQSGHFECFTNLNAQCVSFLWLWLTDLFIWLKHYIIFKRNILSLVH